MSGILSYSMPGSGGNGSGRSGFFGPMPFGIPSAFNIVAGITPKSPLSFHMPGSVADNIFVGLKKAGYSPKRRADGDISLDDVPDPAPSYSGPVSPTAPSYLNADLASHYGMDAVTAYQEALANTAHQREVKDLQAAGLNPVLSARYGGASGVSGAQLMSSSSGSSGSGARDVDDPLASLVGGFVSLFTGSSARGNATEKIIHSISKIAPSIFSSKSLLK